MLPKIRMEILFRLFMGMTVSQKMLFEWSGIVDRDLGNYCYPSSSLRRVTDIAEPETPS